MTIHILDASTGEVTERELNAKEKAQQIKDQVETDAIAADKEAKAQAKAAAIAKLEALGLTTDEIKLLLK